MKFATQSEAKQFVVRRVLEQAANERVELTEAERHMLSWSESDRDFKPDMKLSAALEDQMTGDEFETKIAKLIKRAYDEDVGIDRSMKAQYKEAYSRLAEGDHYISVIIDRALGRRVKKWWPF